MCRSNAITFLLDFNSALDRLSIAPVLGSCQPGSSVDLTDVVPQTSVITWDEINDNKFLALALL